MQVDTDASSGIVKLRNGRRKIGAEVDWSETCTITKAVIGGGIVASRGSKASTENWYSEGNPQMKRTDVVMSPEMRSMWNQL